MSADIKQRRVQLEADAESAARSTEDALSQANESCKLLSAQQRRYEGLAHSRINSPLTIGASVMIAMCLEL